MLTDLAPALLNAPFGLSVRDVIVAATNEIVAIEAARGVISRRDRSALDPKGQKYQDLIDKLFYRIAGMTDAEASGMESRLAKMI